MYMMILVPVDDIGVRLLPALGRNHHQDVQKVSHTSFYLQRTSNDASGEIKKEDEDKASFSPLVQLLHCTLITLEIYVRLL